jgi:hypothetical protein
MYHGNRRFAVTKVTRKRFCSRPRLDIWPSGEWEPVGWEPAVPQCSTLADGRSHDRPSRPTCLEPAVHVALQLSLRDTARSATTSLICLRAAYAYRLANTMHSGPLRSRPEPLSFDSSAKSGDHQSTRSPDAWSAAAHPGQCRHRPPHGQAQGRLPGPVRPNRLRPFGARGTTEESGLTAALHHG